MTSAQAESLDASGLRLAELIGAMSLAVDLGLGQPTEHVLRASLIGLRLAERLGLGEEERAAVYYAALIAWVGCHADGHEQARWFGDDVALRAGTYEVDMVGLSAAGFFLRHLGAGQAPLQRARLAASFLASGRQWMAVTETTHCLMAGELAERLGLGSGVRDPLQEAFERWDGKGTPNGLKGEQISPAARIVHLADMVEIFHRADGVDAAVAVAQERRGTQFDPVLVDRFSADAAEILAGLDAATTWDDLIEASRRCGRSSPVPSWMPRLRRWPTSPTSSRPTRSAARGRSPSSPRAASEEYGLPGGDVVVLCRAGLVHGLGRLGVSNAIWDKPGALTPAEMERVRLHHYLAERMLAGAPGLAALGTLAGQQNERLDGSGYPRGLAASALGPAARVLAAATVYRALREPRPHREERSVDEAEAELREEVRTGRLDGEAVNAALRAAGHRVRGRCEWPAGLTPREIDVLRLLVQGHTNAQIGERLVVAPKTVANHIAHIYMKIGGTRGPVGWLERKHGLACDNLLAVELVTADGQLVRASQDEHPDLFWALHGGGGNFGVATTFEFRLHPVGPEVFVLLVAHRADRERELLEVFRDFAATAPEGAGTAVVHFTGADGDEMIPPEFAGEPLVMLAGMYAGPVDEGAEALRPLREFGQPAIDGSGPMLYADFQCALDDVPGFRNYWTAEYLADISDAALDVIAAHSARTPSGPSQTFIVPWGGAVARVGEDETPMAKRDTTWVCTRSECGTSPTTTNPTRPGAAASATPSPRTRPRASTSTSSATRARTASAPPSARTSTCASAQSRPSTTRTTCSGSTTTSSRPPQPEGVHRE